MQGPVGVGGQTGPTLGRKQGEGWQGNRVTWMYGKSDNFEAIPCKKSGWRGRGKWVTRMDGHRQMGELPYGGKPTRQLGVSGRLGGMTRQTHGSASSLWEGLTHSAGTGEGCR